MSSRRPAMLMGILLVLVLGYVTRPQWEAWRSGGPRTTVEAPLPGQNTVSGLQVSQAPDGKWMAAFEYFYTGEPIGGMLQVVLLDQGRSLAASAPAPSTVTTSYKVAQRGGHRMSVEIQRPHGEAAVTTGQVMVQLNAGGRLLASQQVDRNIDWPDWQSWFRERELARKTPQQVLDDAVKLIDTGDRTALAKAKQLLERLIAKDTQFDAGYVELARVAMKTNWGPEGLRQAEDLLSSALQIRPDSVNAKILLGYVYAHQGRHKPAEALFAEAAQTDTRNLWLWANWGEVLAMQGKLEPAVQKYREAVTRPRTHDTYDRARLDAYERLLALLHKRQDLDGMEALHKQRAQEFGPGSCHSASYARFMLQQRGDAAAAITLARQAVEGSCSRPFAREALGLAHYVAWAGATGTARDEALHQARVFLPAGPRLLYQLAASERTVVALRQLKAAGESLDLRDNYRFTALAYALQEQDLDTARRLLRLGARPDAAIGPDDMPVALLPVISGDIAAIRLMQQFRVDYAKLRHQGATAVDHAKRIGDRRLLEALTPQSGAL
jgi:tetratricopeptide (TPR) repeat protein